MAEDKKALGRVALKAGERRSVEVDPDAEIEALKALAEKYGVPGIDLNQICIRLSDLELLPREIAERRLILPVLVRDDRVFVAMTNPADEKMIDELEFVTGKRVYPYVAVPQALERVIAAAYDAEARGERFHVGPTCPVEIQRKMGAIADDEPPEPPASHAPLGHTTPEERVFPDAPTSKVEDDKVHHASERDEISYSDIGAVDPELSVVTDLPVGPGSSKKAKTILVVDDEHEIRKLLLRVLGAKGYRVLEAERGLDALKMVKASPPDLLLLDAMLPEVNGFEIARRIKGSQKYGHIPIIMVSAVYKGWRFAEDARQSYGVDAYVEKPFRIADIAHLVETILAGERPRVPTENERPTTPPPKPAADANALSADAEKCLNAGVDAYQKGDLDAAIEHLRRGLAIDPLAYRLHFHLGLLYGKKGQIYEAIQELERAIEANDRHFAAAKNLAILYQKAGFKNKAVEAWERALRVAPDDATRTNIKQHLLTLL